MKVRFVFLIFLFINLGFSQSLQLSPNAEVSVLTFGPGESLNDAFGHNAFRIIDKSRGIDLVYGYGEYDFDAPFFYVKFAQGKLNYLISRHRFNLIYDHYKRENRTIKEQVLNLDLNEKQKLFNYLENNYKPENRRYVYDFFYDNCATKIRDVAEFSTNNSIAYNSPNLEEKTFRSLIYEHVHKNTWGSLGIDVALGSIIDRKATLREYMFLPKYIHLFFKNALLKDGEPMVKTATILYTKKASSSVITLFVSPLVLLSLISIFLIYKTYKDYKNNRRSRYIDVILTIITSLIGIVLCLLWFATDHTATAYNYNLLWAFPLNFVIVRQMTKVKPSSWVKGYIKFLIIMLFLMSLHWMMGVQVFALVLIPLLVAMLIRYYYLLKLL